MSAKNDVRQPKQLALSVFVSFKASHSLTGFETPHFHLWKLAVEFTSSTPFHGDRLIDLVFLQNKMHEIVAPIEGRFLNSVFEFQPTTENLAQWMWDQVRAHLPEAPLSAVTVTLCDLSGEASGAARLT